MIQNPMDIDDDVFYLDTYNYTSLLVPVGKVEAYKASVGWKNFFNIVEFNNGDVNDDSKVDDMDIAETTFFILTHVNGYNFKMDINLDGIVNVADIVELVNIIKNK